MISRVVTSIFWVTHAGGSVHLSTLMEGCLAIIIKMLNVRNFWPGNSRNHLKKYLHMNTKTVYMDLSYKIVLRQNWTQSLSSVGCVKRWGPPSLWRAGQPRQRDTEKAKMCCRVKKQITDSTNPSISLKTHTQTMYIDNIYVCKCTRMDLRRYTPKLNCV